MPTSGDGDCIRSQIQSISRPMFFGFRGSKTCEQCGHHHRF